MKGVILRTASVKASKEDILRELQELRGTLSEPKGKVKRATKNLSFFWKNCPNIWG
jgi:Ribonuclease G/E